MKAYVKVCSTLLLAAGLVTGCLIPQKQFTDKHRDFSLGKGELATHGLAFITPSTVTGQEEAGAYRCGGFEREAAGHTLRRPGGNSQRCQPSRFSRAI